MATDMELQQAALQQAADAGRSTDTVLAHLTLGEVVIPREIVEDPEVSQILASVFQSYGADMREFTVGDQANKINPETGNPEFFFKKIKSIFKKIAPVALPILGTMIPGVGTAVGAALGGAAGGLASGGGLKGAVTGAALGGLGGSILGGGASGGLLGHSAGTSLDVVKGVTGLQGPTLGSGIKGALSGGGLSAITSGGGGGLSSFVRPAASIYSAMGDDEAQKRAERALMESQASASRQISPYSEMGLGAQQQLSQSLSAGFNPGDLTSDPGYQFRLREGQDALNKQLASSGLLGSGAALKAAQEYGQGMAATEYGNAYDRWLQQNQQLAGVGSQGYGAAQALGNLAMEGGQTRAGALQEAAERRNRTIAEILAGLGY